MVSLSTTNMHGGMVGHWFFYFDIVLSWLLGDPIGEGSYDIADTSIYNFTIVLHIF